MKKLGILAILALAVTAYSQSLVTDYGSNAPINHSSGVIVYPWNRLQTTKCVPNTDGGVCLNYYAKVLKYYSTVAEYPTTFTPSTVTFDAGCQKYTLTNDANFVGNTASQPLYCSFTVPFASLDAGVFTVYKDPDGGFGVSQCPATAALSTTPWPAFCRNQAGTSPP